MKTRKTEILVSKRSRGVPGRILFLAEKMATGFGVSVVVAEVAKSLAKRGVQVVVGCIEKHGSFPGAEIHVIQPNLKLVKQLVDDLNITVIVAHTSPFFEMLPELDSQALCLAWEHGDPTPEFFSDKVEEQSRRRTIRNKKTNVYPRIAGIITISEFIKQELELPLARVIPNGCDHMPDYGAKTLTDLSQRDGLRIGTLMRLGAGEQRYKGNDLFLQLKRACELAEIPGSFEVMGRGTQEDAAAFRSEGIEVHLNATEAEKASYLRNLDVFVSCSQWEGFNLPLIEAQALGTFGIAFDVGAHPEVTPFIASSVTEVVTLLRSYQKQMELLAVRSRQSYEFVRSRFTWNGVVDSFLEELQCRGYQPPLKTEKVKEGFEPYLIKSEKVPVGSGAPLSTAKRVVHG